MLRPDMAVWFGSAWKHLLEEQQNGIYSQPRAAPVRDQSGAEIPGTTIQIRNQDTGLERTTKTNGSGAYQLGEIPPGVYTIVAQAKGFSTSRRENETLAVSQSLVFNFALQVGTTTSTVQVTTSDVNLNTASTTLGLTIGSQTVTTLPLNGNNYTQELLLMPGVNGGNTNHPRRYPIWGTPGSFVNSPSTFGKVTSQANSPRELQLSAKVTF